jgi:hypothetical protein
MTAIVRQAGGLALAAAIAAGSYAMDVDRSAGRRQTAARIVIRPAPERRVALGAVHTDRRSRSADPRVRSATTPRAAVPARPVVGVRVRPVAARTVALSAPGARGPARRRDPCPAGRGDLLATAGQRATAARAARGRRGAARPRPGSPGGRAGPAGSGRSAAGVADTDHADCATATADTARAATTADTARATAAVDAAASSAPAGTARATPPTDAPATSVAADADASFCEPERATSIASAHAARRADPSAGHGAHAADAGACRSGRHRAAAAGARVASRRMSAYP